MQAIGADQTHTPDRLQMTENMGESGELKLILILSQINLRKTIEFSFLNATLPHFGASKVIFTAFDT